MISLLFNDNEFSNFLYTGEGFEHQKGYHICPFLTLGSYEIMFNLTAIFH